MDDQARAAARLGRAAEWAQVIVFAIVAVIAGLATCAALFWWAVSQIPPS